MSKIEQIISEIEEYIDGCRFQTLSNTKIIVNKDEIEELLAELRLKTPDEIKKYQKIITNKEAILNDAKEKADTIIGQANTMTAELVSEHEIMQQAYVQANDVVEQAMSQAQMILDKATSDANDIRLAAMQYTDEVLLNLQNLIANSMDNINSRHEGLMKSLNTSLSVIVSNREELYPKEEEQYEEQYEEHEELNDKKDYEDYRVNLEN